MNKPKLTSEQKKQLKLMQEKEMRKINMRDEIERQIQLQLKNKGDIDRVWFEIISKSLDTTIDIERVSGSFERFCHNKDKEVFECLSYLENMWELSSKHEASHGEYIANMFEQLLRKMGECHWDYKDRQQKLLEIKNINVNNLQRVERADDDALQTYMAYGEGQTTTLYHKYRYEIEVNAKTGQDTMQVGNINELWKIGNRLEAMWTKFVSTFNTCLSAVTVSKEAYVSITSKDVLLKEAVHLQHFRIIKLRSVIGLLRFKFLKEKIPPKITNLIPPYKRAIVSYRKQFNGDLVSDEKTITDLARKITDIEKYLVDMRQKGEDIFRILALCRPLETTRELVENFGTSKFRDLTKGDKEDLTFSFSNTFVNEMAVLWKRFARIEMSRDLLKAERDHLIAENGVFRRALGARSPRIGMSTDNLKSVA